jgi:hypothetical protein
MQQGKAEKKPSFCHFRELLFWWHKEATEGTHVLRNWRHKRKEHLNSAMHHTFRQRLVHFLFDCALLPPIKSEVSTAVKILLGYGTVFFIFWVEHTAATSTPKTGVVCSSETLLLIYKVTRCHSSKDRNWSLCHCTGPCKYFSRCTQFRPPGEWSVNIKQATPNPQASSYHIRRI